MLTTAVRDPATVGVNVTLTKHNAFGSSDAGQLLVWLKSVAFTPAIEMELMASGPEPVLVTVTGCCALAEFRI
jgi:hypothetical protein